MYCNTFIYCDENDSKFRAKKLGVMGGGAVMQPHSRAGCPSPIPLATAPRPPRLSCVGGAVAMVPPAAADPSPLVAAAAAATEVGAAACAAKAPKAAPVKVVWVMVDGLGDVDVRAVDALAGASPRRGEEYDSGGCRRAATPLALARTPALDALACAGLNGLVDPVEPGLACGSDTAHLSMLSYAPSTYYVGRGAFESLGAVRSAPRACLPPSRAPVP